MTETLKLLALAAVQGLTEFLPVSSSGHLALAQKFFGVEAPGTRLALMLHAGTLATVLVFYRRRVAWLVTSVLRGRADGFRYAGCVLLSMLPAGVAFALFRDSVESMTARPRVVGALLLFNAFLLFFFGATARTKRSGSAATPWRAFAMGFGQAFAVLPGISRSGTSIGVGRLAGAGPAQAAEFSFIMSVPVIAGGVLLEV
ncbi:MAG: undecaprenyl-diphosphate phosphatase, partial [Kiritimatiellae bacterium]|nr:undecaprenyl-diphosphate phosphatase [Kiritimatiellia bacterium]